MANSINKNPNYLYQSQFAKLINENGINFDRKKFNVYFNRGKIPKPDLISETGRVYWKEKTCLTFIEYIKKRGFFIKNEFTNKETLYEKRIKKKNDKGAITNE